MGVKWTGGSPKDLSIRLKVTGEAILEDVEAAVRESVEVGAKEQKQLLDRAVTRYGQYRMSKGRGRSAGRNDTGKMIDDVGSDVESTRNRIVGWWGWVNGAKDYYKYQDWGVGVPAAHSLLDSYMVVRNEIRKRLLARLGKR